jgi:hypothetical protein
LIFFIYYEAGGTAYKNSFRELTWCILTLVWPFKRVRQVSEINLKDEYDSNILKISTPFFP